MNSGIFILNDQMDSNGHSTDKMALVFICIQNGEVRSDHKWSIEMHLDTHCNARCELTYLKALRCFELTSHYVSRYLICFSFLYIIH